jgi:hypothetical protein
VTHNSGILELNGIQYVSMTTRITMNCVGKAMKKDNRNGVGNKDDAMREAVFGELEHDFDWPKLFEKLNERNVDAWIMLRIFLRFATGS